MMISHQNHEMQLEIRHESGVEEWYCPTCGRRTFMQWTPIFNKVVLEVGDESAIHTGSTGGLYMSPTQVGSADELELPNKLRSALEDLLKDIDFDDPPDTADS
jgi:hypothetical protein